MEEFFPTLEAAYTHVLNLGLKYGLSVEQAMEFTNLSQFEVIKKVHANRQAHEFVVWRVDRVAISNQITEYLKI